MEARVRSADRFGRSVAPFTRPFPERVPILLDGDAGLTLRAMTASDLPGLLEQLNDPETVRWTSQPRPEGGFTRADAETMLGVVGRGWRTGRRLSWTIEAERAGTATFCGTIHLRVDSPELAEIGFGLHPAARGRGLMTAAAALVRDFGFDVVGLEVIRWRAAVDNWPSRRVAAGAGFVFDGTVRRSVPHDGQLVDGWLATLTREDPRTPRPWLDQPVLTGSRVTLRAFSEVDLPRIVQACADNRTHHWLVSMPQPYRTADAVAYLRTTRELAATSTGLVWCLADPDTDACLGAISLDGMGGYASRAEIGYWAHPDARGRGLMTQAVGLVTDHAHATGLAQSIMIRIAAGNTASRHVAEAAGYDRAGLLPRCEPLGDGTLEDLVVYAHAVTSVTASPSVIDETDS